MEFGLMQWRLTRAGTANLLFDGLESAKRFPLAGGRPTAGEIRCAFRAALGDGKKPHRLADENTREVNLIGVVDALEAEEYLAKLNRSSA